MRWKLILITSFVGAFVAGGAWCVLTIVGSSGFGVSGSPWIGPLIQGLSLIIPILLSAFAAVFVYRHTAQRRKTQALLTIFLTLLLTVGIYVAVRRLFSGRLSIVTRPHQIK